ncbi:MAG: nucleoside-diphosphate kinase [archaeon]|jgi:nucleoside-diphosphate kinase
MRRTLIIAKPDAINRCLLGKIISRFEDKGLKIVGLKMNHLNVYALREHYKHHKDKPFFEEMLDYMSSIPCVLMIVEGKDAVSVVRKIVGETCGREAAPGTIRGDYSMGTQTNLVHASESDEAAKEEIARFFKEEEIFDYNKMNFDWIYCRSEKGLYAPAKKEGKTVEESGNGKTSN